ncbi:MAG: hypothetical protein HZA46_06240 [Planctomycetales bacterium]|nr:hypothetical protein [Planctomycetales bacterium]
MLTISAACRPGPTIDVVVNSLLVAGAAFVMGGFIGFLCGLPMSPKSGGESGKSTTDEQSGGLRPNDVLQQISEWLLKILLGAGLTQLGNVTLIGDYLKELTGNAPAAMVIVSYFSIAGVFFGYAMTTLYLAELFNAVHNSLYRGLQQQIKRQERVIVQAEALKQTVEVKYQKNEVEYVIFRSLYEPQPEGFELAIRRGEEYLKQDPIGSADIFGHLACAYGQKYGWKLKQNAKPGDAEMKTILSKAVEYGRKAKDLDPEWGQLLQDVYKPNKNAIDNDWETFKIKANDPDKIVANFIKELLTTPTSPPKK